jgi:chromosome segregation ATPase
LTSTGEWEEEDQQEAQEQKLVDHTPPPPPPPRGPATFKNISVESTATSAVGGVSDVALAASDNDALGWDDDDNGLLLLDDVDAAEEEHVNVEVEVNEAAGVAAVAEPIPMQHMVDHTPLEQPKGFHRADTNDAVASRESLNKDGILDDDDDQAGTGADEPIAQHMVDHTPLLAGPPDFRRTETADAVASASSLKSEKSQQEEEAGWNDDDVDGIVDDMEGVSAQDDAQDQKIKAAQIVDHTPPPPPPSRKPGSSSSMAVLLGGSSVAESLESIDENGAHNNGSNNDTSSSKPKFGIRKIVDHTPPTSKTYRGVSLDVSIAVMGTASVGESLDSISEGGEEPESPDASRKLVSPAPPPVVAAAATRWGSRGGSGDSLEDFDDNQPRSDYTISFHQDSTVIPFWATSPPAADQRTRQFQYAQGLIDPSMSVVVPLVDHTPVRLVSSRVIDPSVENIGASSEDEEDFDKSDDGIDNVQEDLYGKVVDHTPETPKTSKHSIGDVTGASINMDDTVQCVAEMTDVNADIKQDDDMDESSHGASTHGTDLFNADDNENRSMRSMLGSMRLTIVEENHLVDHVPTTESKVPRTTDASTLVLADASETSSQDGDNVNDDDVTTGNGFGQIVDHTPSVVDQTPSVIHRSARSVATSVVTQVTGLYTEMKLDEDLDNTVGPGASTECGEDDEGWHHDEPELEETLGVNDEKHLVDHVPDRESSGVPVDASVRPVVDPSDESTQVDTIAEDAAVANFGPIVDHTPLGARSVGYSVAASTATQASGLEADIKHDDDMDNTLLGASTAGASGWDNDEADLEDLSAPGDQEPIDRFEESHLVDHVPQQTPGPRPVDASVFVLADLLDAASEVGDDENDENVRSSRFGLVVDQTPARRSTHFSVANSMATHASGLDTANRNDDDMDGTWFGASTLGGASTVGSTAGGDGWDDDEQELEQVAAGNAQSGPGQNKANHVVDHVPPRSNKRPAAGTSTAVVVDPSVVLSQEKEDDDANSDGGSFGAVVDHTPSVSQPRISRASTANSMSTIVTGLETDIKRDDDMDETTWDGGPSGGGDEGWDRDERELGELADGVDDEMPHLVDHVPERPESRPTDASTLVVAEPSEMESHVDDFLEEQNFGPVVDQTPPSQLNVAQSVAGSSIVAPPSIVDDDLDDAVETAGDDQNGWDNDDIDTIDEAPNPQSGNDTDNRPPLVDYLPPEDEMPELVRDGSSEMATVGEKSGLPADDPIEDEFGPVVDHTPILEPSPPVSERKARRQDDDSRRNADSSASGVQNMDSVAAIFSVASSIDDKGDGSDDDEFGPVVDHLPTVSSRSSFPLSRGGSTVDALATVSEVGDDSIGGGVSDIGIDAPGQVSSIAAGRSADQSSAEDKTLSVKWVDTWGETDAAAMRQKHANTTMDSAGSQGDPFFDAEMGDTSGISLNATRYYDPEIAWNDSLNFDDDDDETPPSTPRRRHSGDSRILDSAERGILSSTLSPMSRGDAVSRLASSCKACSDASTADCPCVQRLLEVNAGNDAMMGRLRTPEGEYIKVNFEKLLQDEITKRHLIEKELQALHSTVKSLEMSKESLVAAGESQMKVLNELHLSNKELTNDLTRAQGECNSIRNENESRDFKDQLAVWESRHDKWRADEDALMSKIDKMQQQSRDLALSASKGLESRDRESQSEIKKLQQSNDCLSSEKSKLEVECTDLRGKYEHLSCDLAASKDSMFKKEEEISNLASKQVALNAEIQHLKGSLEKALSDSSSDVQLKEQINSMQAELASKAGESVELRSQLTLLEQRLQTFVADNFKHAKEVAKISKQHGEETAKLNDQLQASQAQVETTLQAKERSAEEYEEQFAAEVALVQKLRSEKDALEKERQRLVSTHDRGVQEQHNRLKQKETQLLSAEMRLRSLEQEKIEMSSNLSKQTQLAKNAESLKIELLSVSRERQVLQEEHVEGKEIIATLRKQVVEHSIEAGGVASLMQERESLNSTIASDKHQIQSLTDRVHVTTSERNSSQQLLDDVRSKCSSLEAATERAKLLAIKDEAKTAKMRAELESLRREAQTTAGGKHESQGELESWRSRCSELESELMRVQTDARTHFEDSNALKIQLAGTSEQLRSIQGECDSLAFERDNLLARCDELEKVSASTLVEVNRRAEETSRQNKAELVALTTELNTPRHDPEERHLHFQELQARILLIETGLSDAQDLLANKDQIIVILREQQKSSQSGHQDLVTTNNTLTSRVQELEETVADFDDERDRFSRLVEQHASNESNLSQELARLAGERDAFAQERDMLEDDNEEMLVQFGLLKEQMDANQEQIHSFQLQIRTRELALVETEGKLQDTEKRLEGLAAEVHPINGGVHSVTSSETEKSLQLLAEEKSNLQSLVDDLACQKEEMDVQLQSFVSEKAELLNLVQELQSKIDELISSSKGKEDQLVSVIEDKEFQLKNLDERCRAHGKDSARLNEALRESQAIAQDVSGLRDRVQHLDHARSDLQRSLEQKDGALRDMHYKLQNSGQAPESSAELDSLHQTIITMEAAAQNGRTLIRELESICDSTKKELHATKEKLSAIEVTMLDLEMDLDAKNTEELEERLHEVELELTAKRNTVAMFEQESTTLRSRVSSLESQLDTSRNNPRTIQTAKEPSGQASGELRALQVQIEHLKQQQQTSSSETDARESHIEREVHALQLQMTTKDGQNSSLEQQLRALSGDLSNSYQELASKQEDVHRLSTELEDLRSQANQPATSQVLDLTRDEAESTETMRSHIISLANELENSESRRAEAIERLEKERRNNADSLRRLSVSVKRFYSTLSCGDA